LPLSPRVAISYESAHSEEWAETQAYGSYERAIKAHVQDAEGGTLLWRQLRALTKSVVARSRKVCAICDFNLVEKRIGGNTAIPLDINKLTPQVIDDTLDGSLSETPDQTVVGPDFFYGTTSHAVLAQVNHESLLPINAPPSCLPGFDWRQFNAT
jgi:hypothetical protein